MGLERSQRRIVCVCVCENVLKGGFSFFVTITIYLSHTLEVKYKLVEKKMTRSNEL